MSNGHSPLLALWFIAVEDNYAANNITLHHRVNKLLLLLAQWYTVVYVCMLHIDCTHRSATLPLARYLTALV